MRKAFSLVGEQSGCSLSQVPGVNGDLRRWLLPATPVGSFCFQWQSEWQFPDYLLHLWDALAQLFQEATPALDVHPL
jgi:hypothetical protein